MRNRIITLCLALASLAAPARAQISSNTCYALSDGGAVGGSGNSTAEDLLVVINKITGVTSNIGFTATFDGESLALWPNANALFSFNRGRFVRLSLTTGAATNIGPSTNQVVRGSLGNITIDDIDGLTFDATIDPPILYASARRAANGANDLLLVVSTNDGRFVRNYFGANIDYLPVENHVVTNNLGQAVTIDDVDDIAHDSSTDTLYAILNDGGSEDHLVTIDVTNGNSTDLGQLGVDDAEGLTFFVDGNLFVTTGNNGPAGTNNSLFDVNKANGAASNQRVISFGEDYEGANCFTSATSLVGDKVWRDLDQDGIQDPGEPGVPNVTVQIYRVAGNSLVQTKQTDALGEYSFVVPPSDYYIVFTLPGGYSFTTKNAVGSTAANDSNPNTSTGQTDNFTQGPNETDLTIDAGLICNDPVVTCPPNITLECPANTTPGVTGTATATSPCGCALSITFSDTNTPLCGTTFSIVRRWTATDQCGNSSFCDQTITVQDTTDPALAGVPGNTTAACNSIPAPPTVTAADECDTVVPVVLSVTTNAGACAQSYSLVRTWTATDDCGNQASQSQTITVTDTVAPVISGVGLPGVVQCEDPIVFSSPTASDLCDPAPVLTFSDSTTPGSCPQNFTRTRTWTATDACGNQSTASQAVTVVDTNGPTFANVGGPLTVECEQPIVFSSPTVADTCDPVPTLTFVDATVPGSCPQNFVRTRTWTATDACGNDNTASQTITVRDTVAPVISGVGAPATIQCDQPIVFSSPTATDACAPTPGLTFVDSTLPGSCPQSFVRTRTWTATDSCSNSSTASQSITVVDSTDPVISGVGPAATIQCDQPVVFSNPTASDNCDTTPTLTFSDATVPGSCPQNFVRTRTWTATDDCGNDVTASQAITVQDTTNPVISGVGPAATLECDQPIVFSSPTASDNCDTTPTLTFSDATVPGTCPQNFVRTRTWTATDDCGNSSTASQAITVQDTTDPVISGVGPAATIQCDQPIVFSSPTASDNCDTTPTLTFSDATVPGSCPQNFVRTRTWTATDDCGNTGTASQAITVQDTTDPVISGVGPAATLECDQPIVFSSPTASDNCDTTPALTFVDSTVPGGCPQNFVRTRTWTAADDCGNDITASQSITVQDTTDPVISGVGPATTLECDQPIVFSSPTAADNCDPTPTLSFSDATVPGTCPENFVRTRTWTATDDCGNSSTASQAITVRDTTDPVISGVGGPQTIECTAPLVFSTPTAADNCDTTPTLTFVDATVPGACPNNFARTRTWTAADNCGNDSTASQTITVQDTTGPVVTCPGDSTLAGDANCRAQVPVLTATGTDACGGAVTLVQNPAPGTVLQGPGTFPVTITGTDVCGNTGSCTVQITVNCGPAAIDLQKTVYLGNNGAANCPGSELVVTVQGAPVTYCFRVQNTGTVNLSNVTVTDPTLAMPPINVGTLNVGQIQTVAYAASANTLTNVASVVGTPPSGPNVTDSDPAEVRTYLLASVGDRVWLDGNRNGVQDPTELTGVSGATVVLYRTLGGIPVATNTTGASGAYLFSGLVPDAYFVEVTLPTGYGFSPLDQGGDDTKDSDVNPGNGRTLSFILGSGQVDLSKDAGAFCQVPVVNCPSNRTLECPADTSPANTGTATATSPCGCPLNVTFVDSVTPICGNARTISRTWTATDECGNSSSCVQTITVVDTTDPVISGVGPALTIECDQPVVFSSPSASDACDTAPALTFVDSTVPGACPQNFVRTRTWTATDDCGNDVTASQSVTVRDTVAPVISGVGPAATIECDQPLVFSTPTAADNCDTTPTLTFNDATVPGTCPQNFVRTRTWTATDDCGNASTASQAITVRDTTDPVITGVGGPLTIECTAPIVFSTPGATDACDATPTLTFTDATVPGTCPQNFVRTRTWTATDDCGNDVTASQAITVRDTVAPVISGVGGPLLRECTDPVVFSSPGAVDVCDTTPTLTFIDSTAPGACPQNFVRTRTWTATDDCGNTSTASQVITVQDTLAPVISGVGPALTIDCTQSVVFSSPVANDACDLIPTLTFVDATVPGACPQNFVRTRTWTATDDCGNSSTASQAITVRDTTPPLISGVGPAATIECDQPVVFSAPSAADNCDATPTLTFSDATVPGSCPQNFARTRTWIATDDCGNASTASQTITVLDTTDPVISGVGPALTIECDQPVVFSSPTASDNCDTTPSLTFADSTAPGACPQNFVRTRTWTATDDCGNSSTASQAVTVRDTVAPVISGVGPAQTIECDQPIVFSSPTASDNCDTTPTLTFSDATVPGTCPQNFMRTRTWSATDDCGNIRTASQAITVQDTTDPVISGVGPATTIECDQPIVFSSPTASDNCDTTPALTFSDATVPGACPQNFLRTRTWTATDDCGNSSTASQAITVQDTTDPVVSGVGPAQTIECDQPIVFSSPTAADNCDTTPTLTFTDATVPGACPQNFLRTRTWTATDDCGNSSTASQAITVQDTTDPVISGVGPAQTIECDQPIVFSSPTAADNCDTTPTLTFTDATVPGACPQNFLRTRTWTATDDCGNSSTASQAITVQDTTDPVISGVGPAQTIECDQPVVFSSPTAADNCDTTPTLTFTDATVPGACPQNFLRTRTWTATDDCGNSSTASQAITVQDTTDPLISGVGPAQTIECDQPIVFSSPTAADNCDTTPTLTFSDATVPGSCPQNFVRTRTWTATDDCGNSSTASQAITVRDTVAPVISGVGPAQTIECDQPIVFSTPTSADNCDTTPTLTFSDATVPGSCPQNFVRTRTWTATDDCGNLRTASQAITVQDTTDPVISGVGPGTTIECTAPIVFSTPTASDNCDTTPTLTFSDATVPGSCPQNFVRTRTWTATDDCGNSSTASQSITVRDTVAPVISGVGGPLTIECTAPIDFGSPTATDNCDTTPTITFADATVPGVCPQNFVRTRTWTATDDCGNSGTASRSITVRDTVAPVVTCPAPITIECGAPIPAANPASVLAVDACDPTPVVTHVSDVSNGLLCPRTITRTYRATDACGNAVTCTQLITVRDTTAPIQVGTLADQLVQCDFQVPPPLAPSMADACDTNLTFTVQTLTQFSTVPGNCSKTILYRWTIRDDCNNFLRVNQRVIVRDRTRPVITCPAPVTLVGNADCRAAIPVLTPVVTDNCDPSPTITQSPAAGTILGPGTHTVTISARDVCGNTQTCTTTVTINCPPNPALLLLKSVYLGHDGGAGCPGIEKVYGVVGSPVTYCFLVVNTGQVNLTNVTVTDPILNVTASVGNLAVGQSATRFAEATLLQDLVNVGTATGTPPAGPPVSDTDPAEVDRILPSISIQKTVQNGAGAPCPGLELVSAINGEDVTYCFTVTNTGNTPLRNVTVSDDQLGIPPMLIGQLNVGQSVSTQQTAVVNGTVTNVASVTGLPPMGPPVIDDDPAQVVTVGPGMKLEKTVYAGNNGVAGCPGVEHLGITTSTVVTYCFKVTNTGDLPLLNVIIKDEQLGYTNVVGTISVGQSAIRAVSALVTGSVTNVARAQGKPVTGILVATDGAVVGLHHPSLQLNKKVFAGHGPASGCATAVEDLTAPLNSPVTYCFEVVNTGDVHLNNITVFDNDLVVGDPAMEYIQGAFPLPPGQSVLYTYKALVQGALVNTAAALGNSSTPEARRINGLPNSTDADSATLRVGPAQP